MLTIVVDAMGGDNAPACVIEGTIQALQESNNRFEIVLIGQSEKVEPLLATRDISALNLRFLHAPEVVTMEDIPATAVKTKQESSLVKGLQLCKAGQAHAFVSAGNTGAQMAASLFVLGRIPGVLRHRCRSTSPKAARMCSRRSPPARACATPSFVRPISRKRRVAFDRSVSVGTSLGGTLGSSGARPVCFRSAC